MKTEQKSNELKVDFSCTTAMPHRFTVARPESKDKTLIDVYRDMIHLSWPGIRGFAKEISIMAEVDGSPLKEAVTATFRNEGMSAMRCDGYLPVLVCTWGMHQGKRLTYEIAAGKHYVLCRIQASNTDKKPHSFTIRCISLNNHAKTQAATGHLTVSDDAQSGPARTLLLMDAGVGQSPTEYNDKGLELTWTIEPGQTQTGWIVFPYPDNKTNVSAFRDKDWAEEFADAKKEWHDLLDRAVHIKIPDSDIQKAFYACLADILLMRDRVEGPDGKEYIAGQCGTDKYRFPNSHEPSFAAVALDCSGLHHEAGKRFSMESGGSATRRALG